MKSTQTEITLRSKAQYTITTTHKCQFSLHTESFNAQTTIWQLTTHNHYHCQTYPSGSSFGSYGMVCEMEVASVTMGPEPPRSLEIREMTIWPRTVSESSELWRCRSKRWTETDSCGTLRRRWNFMTAMLGRPSSERTERISSTIHSRWVVAPQGAHEDKQDCRLRTDSWTVAQERSHLGDLRADCCIHY